MDAPAPGDVDPDGGGRFDGPPRGTLHTGDRIVVDEAGMLDQDTALALFTVAKETGAIVALVGDRAQLAAVGRGGVLDMAAQIRGRTFDMAEVHRFTDPEYADLTVRMRDRYNPGDVFDQLDSLGLIRLHADGDELREYLAKNAREGEAITVASNEDAAQVNDHIRAERIAHGIVEDTTTTTGSDGLSIGAGDLIQTRKNDTALGVANRQQWIVQHVDADGTTWVRDANDARKREHTRRLPAEYIKKHAHLSYAATAYGVQGVTAPASHTILTDSIGAAVYVGMTRGKDENSLHIIADSTEEARALFIETMERDQADRGLADATERAAEAVRGLVEDGPVKLVNTRVARLVQDAEKAELRAATWERIGQRLDQQKARQQAESGEQAAVIQAAASAVERVRADVRDPLVMLAQQEGAGHLAVLDREATARHRLGTVGRFGKRAARKEHRTATENADESRTRITRRWATPLYTSSELPAWVSRAAEWITEQDPRVVEAQQAAQTAQKDGAALEQRHRQERRTLLADVFGAEAVRRDPLRYELTHPNREAARAASTAAKARREAARLRELPVQEAAARIEAQRAAAEQARLAHEERARKLNSLSHSPLDHGTPHRDGPSLGL